MKEQINVKYTNNRENSVTLTEYPYFIDIEPLYDYKWSYKSRDASSGSVVKGFYKDITDKSLTLRVFGNNRAERNAAIDELNSIFEVDIFDNKAGKITVGPWYTYGYITASDTSDWQYGAAVAEKKVTLTSERQAWYSVLKRTSWGNKVQTSAAAFDKQYEPSYLYDYDYTNGAGSQLILTNPSVNASEFVLTVQGAATSPYLKIGENVYHITADVPAGAVLVVDSTKKTALMTQADGTVINMFSARDADYNIFARIESGANPVVYDGTFLWQLDVIEERSEPRWLTA